MTNEIEVGKVELLEAENRYLMHIEGNPIEIAKALKDFQLKNELSMNQLARQTPYSVGSICKYLSLLDLDPEFQELLIQGKMAYNTGYKLSRLPKEERAEFLGSEERITLEKVESKIRQHKLKQMKGNDLFKTIEQIQEGIPKRTKICPHCGKEVEV